jgi:hypothetical protein
VTFSTFREAASDVIINGIYHVQYQYISYFILKEVMLKGPPDVLVKHIQKENKEKINAREIIFYIFNTLNTQILRIYF